MNPFADQKRFMEACDQTTGIDNPTQFSMYCDLIDEEVQELKDAIEAKDDVEIFDALLDIVVVTIGAMQSRSVDIEGGWNEVIQSNFAKIDSASGKVRRRPDGKVLKPEGWQPPNLAKYLKD